MPGGAKKSVIIKKRSDIKQLDGVVIYDSTKAHGITLADGQKGTGQKLKIVVKEYPGGGYGVTYQPVRKGTGNNKK